MKIVTPNEMKAMDQRTVAEGLFSSVRLMQNAAEALYREITVWMDAHGCDRVLLLAGPGNNGGDAYALACLLYPDYHPTILAVGGENRSSDCAYYYEKCKALGIPFTDAPEGYPLVVDGIFGTGFRGELPAELQALLSRIRVPVAAIDLPSGMDGNSGTVSFGTLRPELTVTFAFKKPCHLFADCGRVVLADIGIPSDYAEGIHRVELTPVLPPRSVWGHKNSYGAVGLRVGAPEYPGAASLAIKGALCSGVGLVYGYLPSAAKTAAAAKFYGPVLREAQELFPLQCNAYLIGSGLGRSALAADETEALWRSEAPLVVDGDGLWHLPQFLASRPHPTVLTPHMGEFSRLCGCSVSEVQRDRLRIAEEFAAKLNLVLVLKDAATLVTDGSRTEILSVPCSALAKGGSGDVLAGLIAGLLAAGMDAFAAAKTGVYLHNRAAHLAAEHFSVRFLQPEIIADHINHAWMELENGAF
ncbi:MAG: NAD(P)H-hydrate dehydratase [Clostridia bacterium]|nr:NAD(P)H-hydrate dehydratase [Clostridia bacterium]